MKKALTLMTMIFVFASLSYSQKSSNLEQEIKTVIETLQPTDEASADSPDEIFSETVLTVGVSTPIAGVSLSPKLRLQWTKSGSVTK